MDVFDALAKARGQGRAVVLVTVLSVEGGAPSHAGAKLVVADGEVLAGTLGCSEFDAAGVALAAEAVRADGPLRRHHVAEDEGRISAGGAAAGGRADGGAAVRRRAIELFAEVHRPEPAVLVVGANPVGRAVADLATAIGRRAVLIAPGGETAVGPGVEVKADDPVRYLLAAPPGAADAVVLSDHDAAWVDEVLRIALASEAQYVGMLGSRRHAPGAVRRLRDAGVPAEHIARLRAPVGLDIGSRTAEEIALAIVAEIVAVERDRPGGSLRVDW